MTNGANALKNFPTFSSFNIQNADGKVILRLSTFVPFLLAGVCVAVIVLLINSTYGRAFKAIRDDEVAAEAMASIWPATSGWPSASARFSPEWAAACSPCSPIRRRPRCSPRP